MAGRKRAELTATGVPGQLARRLRALRDESGLTLRQLAAKSGFSHSALSTAESGRTVPSWDLVSAFVQVCGQDPDCWRQLWEVAREAAAEPAEPSHAERVVTESADQDSSADADGGGPDPAPHNRLRLAILLAAMAAAVIGTAAAIALMSASGGSGPTAAAQQYKPAKDGTDPYDDHCKADEKQLDWQPVLRADRTTFGTVVLMYSPTCQAAWGYLDAPNTSAWTSHIVAHRTPGATAAPSQFNGDAAFGSWGNVLSTQNGCVYVEAYVVDKSGEGPHAKTACIRPTLPTAAR